MNKFFIATLMVLFGFQASAQSLKTVPFVEVEKYLGTWYQIARNPLFFEGNCVCSRQVLSLMNDGNVRVHNSCRDTLVNGPLKEIFGVATNEDPSTNAKFKVDLGLPQKGDYWVIGLDSDYRYAVVSDPSKKSLYILSKTPELEAELYEKALAEAALQLDTSKLLITEQKGCSYP